MRTELEDRLERVHESLVSARDAAQQGLRLLAGIRSLMTEQEIERLRKITSPPKAEKGVA